MLVFASGVSNSGEQNVEAYKREEDLLMRYSGIDAKLIYFSTCSIFDPGIQSSLYVRHKIRIEDLIRKKFKNYLIVRLPLLISNAPNPFTFFNFIAQSVLKGTRIRVQKNAWRYIFDVDDLVTYLPFLISDMDAPGGIVNMAYSNAMPVHDLIALFEEIAGREAPKELVEEGRFYDFDRSVFEQVLEKKGVVFNKDQYNRNVLIKYLDKLKQSPL